MILKASSKYPTLWILAGILFCALLLRLLMIGAWNEMGYGSHYPDDTQSYLQMADSFMRGEGFQIDGQDTSRRVPLYPVLLAFFVKARLFPWGLYFFQAFLGTGICWLLYLLGARWFSASTGLLSCTLMAIDYLSIRQTVIPMPEIVFVGLILLFFFLIGTDRGEESLWKYFFAGVIAGLASLTKEVIFFYFLTVPVILMISLKPNRKTLSGVFLFLISFFLLVGPWLIRNRLIHGKWVPLTISSGYQFYLGNNETVRGNIAGREWLLGIDSRIPEDDPHMPVLLTLEADRYFSARAFRYVRREPERFLELCGIRFLRLFYPFYDDSSRLIKILSGSFSVFVTLLGMSGMFFARYRWRLLLPVFAYLAYLIAVYSVTIAHIRYRFSMTPLWIVFAAYGVTEIGRRFGKAQ